MDDYTQVDVLNKAHNVYLVKNERTGRICVEKHMSVYNIDIFRYLEKNHIPGTPFIEAISENDGKLVVVEEYIPGDNLQTIIDRYHTLNEAYAIGIVAQLCDILSVLHTLPVPIIHRDIKPSNIIVTPDGYVRLIDFNAARFLGNPVADHKASDTRLLGTKGYAAPEQYGFSASDSRSDIFAIGVMYNVMLTGYAPNELLASGRNGKIVMFCTMMDPERRYQDCRALKNAIVHKRRNPAPIKRYRHRFLPPGFRNLNPLHMIVAGLGYYLLFFLTLTLTTEDNSLISTLIYRFFLTLCFLSLIFFTADYLNIQEHMPLCRASNPVVRIIGILLWDVLIFLAYIVIMLIVTLFFYAEIRTMV